MALQTQWDRVFVSRGLKLGHKYSFEKEITYLSTKHALYMFSTHWCSMFSVFVVYPKMLGLCNLLFKHTVIPPHTHTRALREENLFFSLKIVFVLANSANPDEMPHNAAFHLGLHCSRKYQFR